MAARHVGVNQKPELPNVDNNNRKTKDLNLKSLKKKKKKKNI